MMSNVLVTGGAGFIGSYIVDSLVEKGHKVTILDNLDPQVHPNSKKPSYLNLHAEFIQGDVRDSALVGKVLAGKEVVFHEAALVGVGQSMYQARKYVDVNSVGTATILDALSNFKNDVRKLIVAASMSSYGEGEYFCQGDTRAFSPDLRSKKQMERGEWELKCPNGHGILKPIATSEKRSQKPNSIYALTKKDQEDMVMIFGRSFNLPVVALRYFNVFGPRQSLSNPYTGVAAIFMSMIKNNKAPLIYEDGNQTRDFISVHDIARANILAMEKDEANYEIFNVGSGIPVTIKDVAIELSMIYGKAISPKIEGKFRTGDVRHCFADISKIRDKLGFEPQISFEQGLEELVQWAENAEAQDKSGQAQEELKKHGLVT